MTDGNVPLESLLAQRAWVRRVARALTRNEADAEDLAQEAWVRALENGPREEPAVRRWFRTVMAHAARDAHRRDDRRRAREAASARPERSGAVEAGDVVAEAEAHRLVVDAVMGLEEPYRSAVLLRWFRELPVDEVARRTGVPLETARTRLRRGLALLRERFDREHGGDRRAWGVLLLPLLRPEGAPTTGTGTGAATGAAASAATITGALLMGMKAKLAAAAVAALLLGGGVVWLSGPGSELRADRAAGEDAASPGGAGAAAAAARPEVEAPPVRSRAAPPQTPETATPETLVPEGFVVRGRVLDDETSEPVAGATVSVGSEFARMPETEARTTTARDGRFRIDGATEGSFGNFFVEAEGYAAMVFGLPWHQPGPGRADGDAGDLRIVRGSRVFGRVVAADGTTPVPGARILLVNFLSASTPCWLNLAAEWGRTDDQGLFALVRVPPSPRRHYTLFAATAEGIGWLRLPPTAGKEPTGAVTVALRTGGAAVVTVRDAAGAPRGGVRVVASPRFEPLGPDPYAGLHHDAWFLPGNAGEAVFVRATGADGIARFAQLPAGPYEFVAWHEGANSWTGTVGVEEGKEAAAAIVLRDPGAWAVEGVVRAADGVPLGGVELTPAWGPKPRVTEADGRYRFEGLEARWTEFRFTAVREGFAPVVLTVGPKDASKLVLEDVVLEAALPIEGKVEDQDGRPVEGAVVSFQRAVPSPLARSRNSGADGRFSIPDAAAGAWRPQVFPPQPWEEWEVPGDLPSVRGGSRDVTIVLLRRKPGKARLVAEVVDESGSALAPDEAMLLSAETSRGRGFRTLPYGSMDLASGRVVAERVRPGRHRLWVRVESRGVAVGDVTVGDDDAEVRATLTLRPRGSLRGRVEVPEGARLPFLVTIAPADGSSQPSWAQYRTADMIGAARVASDGTFRFEGVVPGRYRLVAQARGAEGDVEAEVPAGGEGEAVLRLAPTGVVSFRLAAPSPSDVVVFEIARDGGDWTTVMRRGGEEGREARHDANVAPGRIRWRVTFPATNTLDAPAAARPAEGEIDVALGDPAVVTVPVVRE